MTMGPLFEDDVTQETVTKWRAEKMSVLQHEMEPLLPGWFKGHYAVFLALMSRDGYIIVFPFVSSNCFAIPDM